MPHYCKYYSFFYHKYLKINLNEVCYYMKLLSMVQALMNICKHNFIASALNTKNKIYKYTKLLLKFPEVSSLILIKKILRKRIVMPF